MRSLLAALFVVSTSASAYELKRDSTGEPASWKTPLRFVIDDAFASKLKTAGAHDAITAALETVNDAIPTLKLEAKAGKPRGMGYDFENPKASTSDVLAPAEWTYNVDAVATTVITISRTTHQIIEADIAFNVRHTDFAVVAGAPETVRYDIQNAMTHELGHALGLAHNDLPNTVMFPRSVPGEISKRTLAADDVEGLKFLYGKPVEVTAEEAARGCSATGSAPFALVALMMVVLLRRRRVLVAVAALVGGFAFVAPVFAAPNTFVERTWKVSKVSTLAPLGGPAVLQSDVTFVRDGQEVTVRIAGGRWGNLEQVVEGVAVPLVGQAFVAL